MRREAGRQPPRDHLFPDLADPLLSVKIHDVDGKLHPEAMDRFARGDPQTGARGQPAMLQQARPPLRAGIRHFGRFSQNGAAITVPNLDSQDFVYNTFWYPMLRRRRLFAVLRVLELESSTAVSLRSIGL